MSRPTPSATELPSAATGPALSARLVRAIAAQDPAGLRALFSTPVTFRAVTPRRFWDAQTPQEVVDIVLGTWFGPDTTITEIRAVDTDLVGDVAKVSYRLAVDLESGPSVVEQVAYYSEQDGAITQLRLVCSGFRPL
ncbi:MAG TPA: hypothetical protein VGN48_18360 [Pedococcus sp.]|jgi:hypothetical protein|nr:hypothetical protein [Pedococcus sp.]